MPQSHHGTPVVPEQGTPAVPEWGTLLVPEQGTPAVLERDMPLWHCSLQQQVPGQDRMLLLVWGFTMQGPSIPPAETSPA